MRGQAKVVVGAEVEDCVVASAHIDVCFLLRRNDAFVLVCAGRCDAVQSLLDGIRHDVTAAGQVPYPVAGDRGAGAGERGETNEHEKCVNSTCRFKDGSQPTYDKDRFIFLARGIRGEYEGNTRGIRGYIPHKY